MTIRASTKEGIEMTLLEDEMWSGLDHYDMVIEIWPRNFPWVNEKKRVISV